MNDAELKEVLERIGTNTKTCKYVVAGDYAAAMMYIKLHDLDKEISFINCESRAWAYRRLLELMEEGTNGH